MTSCQTSRIRELSRRIVRELGLVHDTHPVLEVSSPQLHSLLEIEAQGSLTVAELSKKLCVDKSVASRTISSLMKQGWVYTLPAEGNRRKPYTLTSRGQQMARRINTHCGDVTHRALELLDSTSRNNLERSLESYVMALQQIRNLETINYRRATARDIPMLISAHEKIRQEVSLPDFARARVNANVWRRRRTAYFVAEVDKRIIAAAGVGSISGESSSICHLRDIFVTPEMRRHGIGEELIMRCLKAARQHGYSECYAECATRLSAAIGLYRKLGFRKSRSEPQADRAQCNLRLVKKL